MQHCVLMLHRNGNREGGCLNYFAAVQLLPWTLRAERGELKRHNGMPLAMNVRYTAAILPASLSFGDVIMCFILTITPSLSGKF